MLVASAQSHQHIRVPIRSLDEAAAAASTAAFTAEGRCSPTGRPAAASAGYTVAGVLVSIVSNMGLIISVLIALAVVITGKQG